MSIKLTKHKDDNVSEARGHIINEMIAIERLIDHLITKYFFKDNINYDFLEHILQNSRMTISTKINILNSLYKEKLDELDSEIGKGEKIITKLERLNTIRNDFAHNNVAHYYFEMEQVDPYVAFDNLNVKPDNIKHKTIDELVKEFDKKIDEVNRALTKIHLKGSVPSR